MSARLEQAGPAAVSWLDGRLLEAEALDREARAISSGPGAPGVFETLRGEGDRLWFPRDHLARLADGARRLALSWPPPWEPAQALATLVRARRSSGAEPYALRLTWRPPHLVLVEREFPRVPREPLLLVGAPGEAELPRPFGAKTLARSGYDALRARLGAEGAFEALVRASDGELVEGTVTNVFLARDGELATPPLASGALPGIVRGALLAALEAEPLRDAMGRSWRVVERPLAGGELATAAEVLLTNSLAGVFGATRLRAPELARADLPGPTGPVLLALRERLVRLEAVHLRPVSPPGEGNRPGASR